MKSSSGLRDSGQAARQRSPWWTALKTIVGLSLLAAILIWNDNGSKLLHVLSGFRIEYLALLLLIAVGTNGISSAKWGLFLKVRGYQLSFWRLFELYLIGKFFSNFLPSMFGGDVARTYFLGRQISSYSVSAATVLLERASGLVGLILLVILGCAINPSILDNPIVAVSASVATLATTLGLVAFFRPDLFHVGARLVDRIPLIRSATRKFEKLLDDIGYYRSNHRLLLASLAYSLAFHLVAALNVYVSCLAIGFEPQFLDIMVLTPVILLLAMIPVSPNNIGWWEWCFSVLLASIGATAAEGLAVALVIRAVTFVMSLFGGLLLLRKQPPPQTADRPEM
jgi:uncharacterized protein (TIRG00374 family)